MSSQSTDAIILHRHVDSDVIDRLDEFVGSPEKV
jgi:hypothetical protein